MWLNLSSKSNSFLSNPWNAYLALAIAYVLCCMEFSPAFQGFGVDKEVFRYMGMLLANEGVPYTDAFDHKPPIIYLVNYLGFMIADHGGWGVFIINNLLGLCSALFLFAGLISFLENRNAAFYFSLGYIAFINFFPFLDMGNMTRQLCMYFTIILLSTYFLKISSSVKFITIGILAGLIFFTQQNEILASIPIIVFFFFHKHKDLKEVFQRMLFFGMGLGSIVAMLYGQLMLWGNFDDFIDQAFLFNFNSYIPADDPAPIRFYNFIKAMFRPRMLPLLGLMLVALGWTLLKIKTISKFQIVLIGALLLQLFSGSMSGRHYSHYYMMLLPFIAFLLAYNFKGNFSYSNSIWPIGIIGFLISYIIIKGVFMIKLSKPYPLDSVVHQFVQSVEHQKGQFYTFDKNHLGVNTDLEIIAPSKWIYTQFAFTNYDPNGEIIDDILNGFEAYQTKFILLPEDFKQPKVLKHLEQKFKSIHSTDQFTLFERR